MRPARRVKYSGVPYSWPAFIMCPLALVKSFLWLFLAPRRGPDSGPQCRSLMKLIVAGPRFRFSSTEAVYFLSDVRDGPASLASFLDASVTEVRDALNAEALAAAFGLMN